MLPNVKRKKYSLHIITVMKKRTKNKLTLQTRKGGGGSRIELNALSFIVGSPKILSNIDKSGNRSVTFFFS